MRPIDADALKDKLQQHHDLWVMAWGGFSKMPISDKKRVDEITNCIAEVVNAPTIEPKRGEWIRDASSQIAYRCTVCNTLQHWSVIQDGKYNFCPNCGADMRKGADDE